MQWVKIVEGEHKTLPPEGKEVFFDGGENPPVFGRIVYNGVLPSLLLLDSSGEEEYENVWRYERWLDESVDYKSLAEYKDALKDAFEAGYKRGEDQKNVIKPSGNIYPYFETYYSQLKG